MIQLKVQTRSMVFNDLVKVSGGWHTTVSKALTILRQILPTVVASCRFSAFKLQTVHHFV